MITRLEDTDQAVAWLHAQGVTHLQCDSRKVKPGDAFIAWPGASQDGRQFVGQALALGAVACVVGEEGADQFAFTDPRIASFELLKTRVGHIASGFYRDPSRDLSVIAITGTNGKTSSAWWIAQMLSFAERKNTVDTGHTAQKSGGKPICGMIGTLGIGVPPAAAPTGLTTPDPVLLQRSLREMAQTGMTACALEASSIGIAEHRLDATRVRVAVFTNFTQDHLDYHGTMSVYWDCKRALFDWPDLAAAVVNLDDANGQLLASDLSKRTQTNGFDLWTYSCDEAGRPARLCAVNIVQGPTGMQFDVLEAATRAHVSTRAIGLFNVSNLMGCIATARSLGHSLQNAVQSCASLVPVPGRLESVGEVNQPLTVIDYAHTPDALSKALSAVRPMAAVRGGRVLCIFGCGGDRDPGKRPIMGAIAAELADAVVLTSDNPRSEAPLSILSQIRAGIAVNCHTVSVVAERSEAIVQTISSASINDVILIAGKGHETTQEIGGVLHPFSDKLNAQSALSAWSKSNREGVGA